MVCVSVCVCARPAILSYYHRMLAAKNVYECRPIFGLGWRVYGGE